MVLNFTFHHFFQSSSILSKTLEEIPAFLLLIELLWHVWDIIFIMQFVITKIQNIFSSKANQ